MTLPPLPLTNGVLFVDNSGWLEGLQSCHRLVEYKSLHRRISAGEKPSLNFGSCIHLCLEHRYRKYGAACPGPSFGNEIADIITKYFDSHPVPADDWRTANWAVALFKKYMERYEVEDFSILADSNGTPLVELSFTLPLYTHSSSLGEIPVVYTGRIDLPVFADGGTWVLDHKTTSVLGSQFFDRMKRSAQQKGYCWAFQELTGKPVTGYIVNAIRTKEPPQYVLTGTKSGKYTPETWWQESLGRERYYLTPGAIDEWKRNTISHLETFFWHYQNGFMPESTTYCTLFGKCAYYDVCTLAKEDRGTMLNSGMFVDNDWSPLKEATEPKQ